MLDPVALNSAGLVLAQLGCDAVEREYSVELARFLVFLGAACAIAATGDYQHEMDALGAWIEERCIESFDA